MANHIDDATIEYVGILAKLELSGEEKEQAKKDMESMLGDGNRYEITAKVNGMETGGLFNLTGGATLTMETQVGDTIVFFTAEFEKEQEDGLKLISVGDTITFIGTCYGANFTDCELQ